jgi:hypothetical protein
MMSSFAESDQLSPDPVQENTPSAEAMVIIRSFSEVMKTEGYDRSSPRSPVNTGGEAVDNELFVPLSGPLPAASTADEAQSTTAPDLAPPEPPKPTKPTRGRKRKNPLATPESEPAKKKKAPAVKPSPAEANPLEFTEAKPDVATMMGFPLPKVNHGGTRPLRVPRDSYSTPSITDMDDANAVERAFRDLLAVREVVDWESRWLGRRLWLLRKKAALEAQREDTRRSKMWEQDNRSLEEDIKKLEAENGKLDK